MWKVRWHGKNAFETANCQHHTHPPPPPSTRLRPTCTRAGGSACIVNSLPRPSYLDLTAAGVFARLDNRHDTVIRDNISAVIHARMPKLNDSCFARHTFYLTHDIVRLLKHSTIAIFETINALSVSYYRYLWHCAAIFRFYTMQIWGGGEGGRGGGVCVGGSR